MLPFGVTIPATVPQRSEFSEEIMNYPVQRICRLIMVYFTISGTKISIFILVKYFCNNCFSTLSHKASHERKILPAALA